MASGKAEDFFGSCSSGSGAKSWGAVCGWWAGLKGVGGQLDRGKFLTLGFLWASLHPDYVSTAAKAMKPNMKPRGEDKVSFSA